MYRQLSLLLVWLCFVAGDLPPAGAAAVSDTGVTRVELTIDEPLAERSVAWPVTTGIPFPRGALHDQRTCRLVDDRGAVAPLQARVAARWLPERTSIRWLTIDFIAQPGREYWLEFGPGIRAVETKTTLRITQSVPGLTVTTGAIQAEFRAAASSALAAIRTDLDGNGKIDPSEVVLRGPEDGDHYYLNQRQQRFSNARDGVDRQLVIEESGPVRACIRVDGFYTGPDGRRIARCRTRYHFFDGLGLVKVIDEFKITGSTKYTRFRDIGFALELAGNPGGRQVVVDASGDPGVQALAADWQPGTQSISSFQATYRHFGNPACRGAVVVTDAGGERELRAGEHVGEWMQVAQRQAVVTGSLRWFWQQFPKEWEATPDRLVLHLWSPRGGALDFSARGLREFLGDAGARYLLDWQGARAVRDPVSRYFYFAGHEALNRGQVDGQGINKHHEFYLHVAPRRQAVQGREYGRLAAKPPLALATGAWNCSTDACGPLAARPNDSPYEAIVDRIFNLGRMAQDTFGDYGWWVFGSGPHYSYQWDEETGRHYADPRRFEYHTYQKETQLWWCYLRSGERKFFDWAVASEDHWVDIAVTHVPLSFRCEWRGGIRQPQTLSFRPGDWSIDSPLFYVRQRDSAEAWLRGGSQFWASYHRTLETTTLAYYLTGDERYQDVLEYWRDYWRDLAGKTNVSPDVRPWHREQPWFDPDGPEKSWAEMIRDYAPFTSGLRHQMTQLFNLATLQEHFGDPPIGQVLAECAEAYLDPTHRIGVWRTQENSLPHHAEAPFLCHYWVPALWKYERATGDQRIKDIFQRYFDACYAADPFREDVGRYSNVHLAYAYYYTRDPRHLRPALLELEQLLPAARGLEQPEELGQRLYNPFTPIRALTAVPRLVWALEQAGRDGVSIPAEALLKPQRTAIAIKKPSGRALRLTFWGYDRQLEVFGPDARSYRKLRCSTQQAASEIQPFDRDLAGFEVFLHSVIIPAAADPGYYVFDPNLELALLDSAAETTALVNAARPVALDPDQSCLLSIPADGEELKLDSAAAAALELQDLAGNRLTTSLQANRAVLSALPPGLRAVRIRNTGRRKIWFQIADRPAAACWVTFAPQLPATVPSTAQSAAAIPEAATLAAAAGFVEGRFGQAVQLTGDRQLHLPDHITVQGRTVRLFDLRQGTIEFWLRIQWDPRLVSTKQDTYLSNGLLQAWCPWKLPLRQWAHVAVEWRPLKRDPRRQAVHIYVNGRDPQNYRSTWWEGYSQKPREFPQGKPWIQEFLCAADRDAPFAIDEVRISDIPRYANLEVELGRQQLFNPSRFTPPAQPFTKDRHTLLLFHFDENLHGASAITDQRLEARLNE